MPSQATGAEPLSYLESLSNWGRWGPDDQMGTLNLITPEHRVAAARLVTAGRTVSCARDLVTAFGDPASSAQLYWVVTGQGCNDEGMPPTRFGADKVKSAVEFFGLVFHGPNVTHLDTSAHLFWEGRLYNDRPAGMTTSEFGALWCAVTEMREGIVGRGVLVDVPRALGRDTLEPGHAVTPEEIEQTAEAQGVSIGEGDVVLLRTGRWHETDDEPAAHGADEAVSDDPAHWHAMSGWHPACMAWLHERNVAMIGCDYAQDVMPTPWTELPGAVHVLGLVAMGLPLIDNCDLEDLAATCAELDRWEFQFVLAPLRIVGGSGSPVNPLAIF
jgi:kynurenine formamidase